MRELQIQRSTGTTIAVSFVETELVVMFRPRAEPTL